jgi:hypothetical protein
VKNSVIWTSIIVAALFIRPSVGRCEIVAGYGWHIYETKTYLIVITETCRPGDMECDATYVGTNKQNGSSILLKGKTALRMCANDPNTPCGIDGWEFTSGSVDYFFITNGELLLDVSVKKKMVLSEEAKLVAEGDGLSGVTYPAESNK